MTDTLKYIEVNIHPVDNGWVTVKPIIYRDIYIGVGFYTNGANIPRLLWTLIPPNDPMSFPAVVVHDFLCDRGQYVKADDYMEDILISSKVKKWKRISIVIGIRSHTKVGRPIVNSVKSVFSKIVGVFK